MGVPQTHYLANIFELLPISAIEFLCVHEKDPWNEEE